MQEKIKFEICSQNSMIAYLLPPISEQKQELCWAICDELNGLDGVKFTLAGMNTINLYTEDLSLDELLALRKKCEQIAAKTKPAKVKGTLVEIEVSYGGEAGLDLASLAKSKSLSPKELIALHTAPEYIVYFMGFLPGFAYMGGLDERLFAPRLDVPRTKIPAGSVGIGGAQTGIYPIASPGGWQLLGATKAKLFDPDSDTPSLLKAGDRVKFIAKEILL